MPPERITNPGETISLNPQPLPPGPDPDDRRVLHPGEAVELNPQPLPPKEATLSGEPMADSTTDEGGTMALAFYVTITGAKQGKFKGESSREQQAGKLTGLGFSYEVTSPRDVATGQAAGKIQRKPVVFLKEWGAASPQLYQAAVTNEVLKSVVFEFLRTSPDGQEEISDVITLTNAFVSHLKRTIGDGTGHAPAGPVALDEITLSFQKIQLENRTGKTSVLDDWSRV